MTTHPPLPPEPPAHYLDDAQITSVEQAALDAWDRIPWMKPRDALLTAALRVVAIDVDDEAGCAAVERDELRAKVARLIAERDAARRGVGDMRRQRDAHEQNAADFHAELERQRPVIEAALAWRYLPDGMTERQTADDLIAAVDAVTEVDQP